jgi:hypothetical protein
MDSKVDKGIAAIPTRYKGYHFRSRLEARYAVAFDALGIEWEYEKEGYETPYGWYLPDFWIPVKNNHVPIRGSGYFIEIKGIQPTLNEKQKIAYIANKTGHSVKVFIGIGKNLCGHCNRDLDIQKYFLENEISESNGEKEFNRDHPNYILHLEVLLNNIGIEGKCSTKDAINAGLSARFEHGESGAT